MYSFPSFELVCCSMSGSNYRFLTCIQISQEAGKVVSYFHLLKNFPQFVVIHTDKGFSVVNEADVFLEFSWFFHDRMNVGNLISGCSAFSWASLVAQRLKHLPAMWETWVRSLGQEDALEKEMATHSSILAWTIPWMEEPDGIQSTGSQKVRHDWATSLHFCFF